jgi:hypothetical protein
MYCARGSVGVVVFLLAATGMGMDSPSDEPTAKTFTVIQDCMSRSPAPWPASWAAEYVGVLRRAAAPDANSTAASSYARRLDALAQGFAPYWRDLQKAGDRPTFEVQLAQIRWYAETLFHAGLPDDPDRQKLRDQYAALWNDAAAALVSQFPFLDANEVQKAKNDSLAECGRNIDAPLLPIFLRPFTDVEWSRLRQAWQDLRYSRVDLWRDIVRSPNAGRQPRVSGAEDPNPHYLLASRSLAQLLSQVWRVATVPPDYYRNAVSNLNDAKRRLSQARSQAFMLERRIERERSRSFLQTEEIGFLLSVLIETAEHAPAAIQEEPESATKGGDAYEVGD